VARAHAGPRANFYQGEDFMAWFNWLDRFKPERPDRLQHAYFQAAEPVSLVIEEVEALWAKIAEDDDWSGFHQKLAAITSLREALA
jgi:hypothetical protein